MAQTWPSRTSRWSRALTSIGLAGALVAGSLTYSATQASAPAYADPCPPGAVTCAPGPGPGPTAEVPTGPQTTAPSAPTTTVPPAQQTEAPGEPTPNQGTNGMNVQTPNQPATTNPNGIFGTPTPQPTQQAPTSTAPIRDSPTTAAPPTQQQSSSDQQCKAVPVSAVQNGAISYRSFSGYTGQLAQAIKAWTGAGSAPINAAAQGQVPSLIITDVNKPGEGWSGEYQPSTGPGIPGVISLNTAQLGNATAAQVQAIMAHELGHALGLPEGPSGSVMSPNEASVTTPQPIDIQALSNPGGGCATTQAENSLWSPGCLTWHNDDGSCVGAQGAREVGEGALCVGAVGMALAPLVVPGGMLFKLFKVAKSYKKIAELVRLLVQGGGNGGKHAAETALDKMVTQAGNLGEIGTFNPSTAVTQLLGEVIGVPTIMKYCAGDE